MDTLTVEQRSAVMSRVRSKNTRPELIVRSILHRMGFRFRLHRSDLPGRPDIVLPRHGAVVFVHGCFWHGHHCKRGSEPSSNIEFWRDKIDGNRRRDRRSIRRLRRDGWRVVVVWECQTKVKQVLERKLRRIERDAVSRD
jgi:DNA mismatch endonuclease (patch repair protein)